MTQGLVDGASTCWGTVTLLRSSPLAIMGRLVESPVHKPAVIDTLEARAARSIPTPPPRPAHFQGGPASLKPGWFPSPHFRPHVSPMNQFPKDIRPRASLKWMTSPWPREAAPSALSKFTRGNRSADEALEQFWTDAPAIAAALEPKLGETRGPRLGAISVLENQKTHPPTSSTGSSRASKSRFSSTKPGRR